MCLYRAAAGRKKKVAEVPDNPVGEQAHILAVEGDRPAAEVERNPAGAAHNLAAVGDNLAADTSAAEVGHSPAAAAHNLAADRKRARQ